MTYRKFRQYSETAPLKKVIMGRYRGYRAVEEYVEIVNEDQKEGLPETAQLAREFDALESLLADRGVEVLKPDYVGKFVYDQLTPRDLGVAIGDRFVLCNMAKSSRRYEAAGIFRHILEMEGEEPNIVMPPRHDALLEGGDVIVHDGRIYVGISQRTNKAGADFLKAEFSDRFEVVPVRCKTLDRGENVLHLDCIFNVVGEKRALIYPEGFQAIPGPIKKWYDLIRVSRGEQEMLATNVLSIDEQTVISRDHPACDRVNREMEDAGLEVIALPFDGAPKTGGSFRCCTLPLVRE